MPAHLHKKNFKITVLDRMQQNLLQVQKLQYELLKIVKLNNQLSNLDNTDIESLLNEIDPDMVELQKSFLNFIEKNQQRDDESLLEIHHGIDSLLYIQANAILDFCKDEAIIDKQKIVKTAIELKKTSRTIIVLESLLTQRNLSRFNKVDFSKFRLHLNEKINSLETKEKSIKHIVDMIHNVSAEGQLSDKFQELLHYLEQGGSLDTIEKIFTIERIELASSQKLNALTNNKEKATYALVFDHSDKTIMQQSTSDNKNTIEYLLLNENSVLFQLKLFIQTFKIWFNTPFSIGWFQSKKRAINQIKHNQLTKNSQSS